MDTSETIIRVFTKYDIIVRLIAVPLVKPYCPRYVPETPWEYSVHRAIRYHLLKTEKGLEGVTFAHYIPEDVFDRLYAGGFIGESKARFIGCKVSGEVSY